MTEWRSAPGYPGYEVSSSGTVRGLAGVSLQGHKMPERMLSLLNHPKGYKMVSLQRDGKTKKVLVHRLVCEAFHGPAPDALMTDVCHKDEVKDNNVPENLEWGTRKRNIQQYADSGRYRNQNTGLTHCKNNHAFDSENTRVWVSRRGTTHRICKKCQADRTRRAREDANRKS